MYLNGYDAWIYGENVSRRYYFVITVSQEFFLILLLINASVLSRKEKFVSIPVGSSIVSSRSLALIYFYRIRMEPMSTISIEGIESGYERISQGGMIFKQTLGVESVETGGKVFPTPDVVSKRSHHGVRGGGRS